VFFTSAPDSGYSLDNLAPAPPQNFTDNGGLFAWDPAPEPDFAYFRLYGSPTGLLDGSETELTATTGTSFSPPAGHSYYLLTAIDFSGNEGLASVIDKVTAAGSTPRRELPLQVHPNPFNPATTIRFSLATAGPVSLHVYDARGRRVASLLEEAPRAAGEHSLAYRSDLRSGTYFLRLSTAEGVQTRKVALVR